MNTTRMSWAITVALLLALSLPAVVSFEVVLGNARVSLDDEPGNPGRCLATRCPFALARCVASGMCRTCTACMTGCGESGSPMPGSNRRITGDGSNEFQTTSYEDTDQAQLCQTHCFFKYADATFNALTQCGVDHRCFPSMTWSNTTCPRADIAGRIPDFPVERLARDGGEMVVVRGSHPIYDCLPCQRLQFRFDMKERAVKTRWSTAIDGVVRAAEYTLRQESSNRFVTKYSLFGMPVEEHYYIVDATEDSRFVLYFYCGYGFGGEYQGALVYARRDPADKVSVVKLPADVEHRFADALAAAKLTKYVPRLSQFCTPTYKRDCENM